MADFFSVQDISLCLGGRQILDHVSFSVDTPGRVIGLLGPNGGGKTTLLRAICGELPHDGHVFLEGAELAGLRSMNWHGGSAIFRSRAGSRSL